MSMRMISYDLTGDDLKEGVIWEADLGLRATDRRVKSCLREIRRRERSSGVSTLFPRTGHQSDINWNPLSWNFSVAFWAILCLWWTMGSRL